MRLFVLLILFSSCTYNFPPHYGGMVPTSKNPGALSTVTYLPHNDISINSFYIHRFDGYPDSKVIGYSLPKDTVVGEFFQKELGGELPFEYKKGRFYPGTVWISKNKLMDEVEITNLHWAEFLYYVKRDSSDLLFQQMEPDNSKLPREDYFTNPFFRFYPVVGITYEQAVTYCKWRSDIVNRNNKKEINSEGLQAPKPFILEFRLPSETEWETYAACGIDLSLYPYGVKFTTAEIKVNPKSASYLKQKNALEKPIKEIANDIKEFNKSKTKIIMFNVDRENEPYFLNSNTPFYVFDLPINNLGLYNMIGNVSELVREKGITKGGSYKDNLSDCKIADKGRYTGAAPTVGFRTICEIKVRSTRSRR